MKKICMLGLLFLQIGFLYSQENAQPYPEMETEIQSLKDSMHFQRIVIEELKREVTQNNRTYKAAQELYDVSKKHVYISDWVLSGSAAIILFILGFSGLSLTQYTRQLKQEYAKKISSITETNKDLILDLVSKHNKEEFLLKNSKILIINKQGTSEIDQTFMMILKRFKNTPKEIDTYDFKEISLSTLKGFDAIIIDNFDRSGKANNWNFGEDSDLKNYLIAIATQSCENGSAFLYFGSSRTDGHFADEIKSYNHLINFAQKPATLFANLIDLLDYCRLLKKS